tara:strand:+ start:228 stop:443 length:216 start_codon:yes stop_codon:yes gene_type:complete
MHSESSKQDNQFKTNETCVIHTTANTGIIICGKLYGKIVAEKQTIGKGRKTNTTKFTEGTPAYPGIDNHSV